MGAWPEHSRHISALQWGAAGAVSLTAWAWGWAGTGGITAVMEASTSDPRNRGRARHRHPLPAQGSQVFSTDQLTPRPSSSSRVVAQVSGRRA